MIYLLMLAIGWYALVGEKWGWFMRMVVMFFACGAVALPWMSLNAPYVMAEGFDFWLKIAAVVAIFILTGTTHRPQSC